MGKTIGAVVVLLVCHVSLVAWSLSGWFFDICDRPDLPKPQAVFEGDSAELKATRLVPTLDAPIEKGTNFLWCASAQAGWKTMQEELFEGRVDLSGNPPVAQALNAAADPRGDLTPAMLYTAAGFVGDGICEKIAREIPQRFPSVQGPDFSTWASEPTDLVAYAYLQGQVKFPRPYFQYREPIAFTARDGTQTPINAFGVGEEDKEYNADSVRKQVAVYDCVMEGWDKVKGCVLDRRCGYPGISRAGGDIS